MIRRRTVLWVALVLFAGLVVVLVPTGTGIPLHEWLSLVVVAPLLLHLLIDWRWIRTVSRRFLQRQSGRTRFNYLWDWILFALFTTLMVSGLLISEAALPAIGISTPLDPYFWSGLHLLSSRLFMLALGVHLAMHWRWIAGALRGASAPAVADELEGSREADYGLLSPLRGKVIPTLVIFGTGVLLSLALLPLAGTAFADSIRAGMEAEAVAEAGLPRRGGPAAAAIDLFWVGVTLSVPALLTLGILGIAGRFRRAS